MDNEILKDCKEYIIKRVINPRSYWMIPCEQENSYLEEVKLLEKTLATGVSKVPRNERVLNGMVVAIKNKSGFQRAIVQDVFCKHSLVIYSMLLVDHGNIVDISEKEVYYINNDRLRNKQSGFSNVLIHDIAPAALKIECEKSYSSIIFQKRACKDWSPQALSFVNSLFSVNSHVFFKHIFCTSQYISGEIYFVQKPENVVVSLSELLCSKSFAVKSHKLSDAMEDYKEEDLRIEDSIPTNALIQKNCDKPNSYKLCDKNCSVTSNSNSADQPTSSIEHQKKFFNHSSALTPTMSEEASKSEDILDKGTLEESISFRNSCINLNIILQKRVENFFSHSPFNEHK